MIRQPLIPRSSFWADVVNLLTLRRLYREPANDVWQPCDRCGQSSVTRLTTNGPTPLGFANIQFCQACMVDFAWFVMAPIEQPNSSSDSLSGETEVPNG